MQALWSRFSYTYKRLPHVFIVYKELTNSHSCAIQITVNGHRFTDISDTNGVSFFRSSSAKHHNNHIIRTSTCMMYRFHTVRNKSWCEAWGTSYLARNMYNIGIKGHDSNTKDFSWISWHCQTNPFFMCKILTTDSRTWTSKHCDIYIYIRVLHTLW